MQALTDVNAYNAFIARYISLVVSSSVAEHIGAYEL